MNIKIILIIIAFVNPNETESFNHYVTHIREMYTSVGAKPVKYPVDHMVLGDEKPDFIMVVEFPNQEALQELFMSKEYNELAPFREKAFNKLNVFLSKQE